MSWIERLDSKLKITTGDNNVYYPLWQESELNIEYNVEGFDFVNVEGTFVERREKSGGQYPLNLFFVGENNIELAQNFEISARNKNAWTIEHPFFEKIVCQPMGLKIVHNLNVTNIQVTVWETLTIQQPTGSVNVPTVVEQIKLQINENYQPLPAPPLESKDFLISKQSVNTINSAYQNIAVTIDEKAMLKAAYREAIGAVNNILNDYNSYLVKAQNLVNFPFTSTQSTYYKVVRSFDLMKQLINIFTNEEILKANVVTIFSNSCSCAASGTDYITRTDVVNVITILNEMNSLFFQTFDSVDPQIAFDLDRQYNITVSSLYDIAFYSKQERSIILDSDSNMVILAHKYFGSTDADLKSFINLNELKIDEYLQIKQGRLIKWLA